MRQESAGGEYDAEDPHCSVKQEPADDYNVDDPFFTIRVRSASAYGL